MLVAVLGAAVVAALLPYHDFSRLAFLFVGVDHHRLVVRYRKRNLRANLEEAEAFLKSQSQDIAEEVPEGAP